MVDQFFDEGNKLTDEGRYSEAIEEYDKAIELDPNFAPAIARRGFAYSLMGEDQQAILVSG